MKRIAVVGARPPHGGTLFAEWDQHLLAAKNFVFDLPQDVVVITGGATGIDRAAEDAARGRGLRLELFLPETYGGPRPRNEALAATLMPGDELHAFPWPGCKGTWHVFGLAKKRPGVKVEVHKPPAGIR